MKFPPALAVFCLFFLTTSCQTFTYQHILRQGPRMRFTSPFLHLSLLPVLLPSTLLLPSHKPERRIEEGPGLGLQNREKMDSIGELVQTSQGLYVLLFLPIAVTNLRRAGPLCC